jgi:hypothetical protein
MPNKANPTVVLAGGLVIVLATMVAYIYCAEHGIDSAPLLAIVGPVIVGLLLQNGLSRVEAQARQAVENTNGKLDGGIRDAVAAELNAQLDARGLHRAPGVPVERVTSGMTTPDDQVVPMTTAGGEGQPR